MATLTMQFTNTGLTKLASAPGGSYVAPQWLVIDTTHTTFYVSGGGTLAAGATSVSLNANVSQAGDTQIVVGVGTPNQEVLTFSGTPTLSGSQYVYALVGATQYSHNNGDICVRQPTVTDTVANIVNELQIDPVNLPNLRSQVAAGYAPGSAGQWTIQFYLTGQQASGFIAIVGMADSVNVGQGTLHAIGVLGVDHTIPNGQPNTNDLEIDALVTISNG